MTTPSTPPAAPVVPTPEPHVAAFEKLGYGMFLHYGLYSLMEQGEWVRWHHKVPADQYNALQKKFSADSFDGRALARTAKQAGMKYLCLTSRHHDGFSLYDTRGLNTFDAPHSPAGRDLVQDFVTGCRAEGVVPFLYHTTLDWTWDSAGCDEATFNKYLDYLLASVEIVCTHYGELGGLWFDGNWSRRQSDWKEDRLYRMIRQRQPQAMIINNSSVNALGAKGHPLLDAVTYEQGRPSPMDRRGMSRYLAAEMCQTMNHHWGIAAHDFAFKSPAELILDLAACRRVGANYLLNLGPTGAGALPAYETAAILKAGQWVALHARALYDVQPMPCTTVGRDFVLRGTDGTLYLFVHDLIINRNEHIGDKSVARRGLRTVQGLTQPIRSIKWLDNDEELAFTQNPGQGLLAVDCTAFP